jgi:hypothetical protein
VRKWFKEQIYDPSVVMNKATIQAMVIKDENCERYRKREQDAL